MQYDWISPETEPKERDFTGLLAIHLRICQKVIARRSRQSYLYIDLHAGPGILQWESRQFSGSPLIFLSLAEREGLDNYEAVFFERDQSVAEALATELRRDYREELSSIHLSNDLCENGLPEWLGTNGYQPNRYGLIYSDPIGKPMPAFLLHTAAKMLPRVDILSYTSATTYKRLRGVGIDVRLSEDINLVGKRYKLIREPRRAWQWTFVLWTNWDGYPEWRKKGFYRVDSPDGERILQQLDSSAREIAARQPETELSL